MSKKKKKSPSRAPVRKGNITVERQAKPEGVVVQQLNIMAVNRAASDLDTFKSARTAAESVHFPNRTRLYDLYTMAIENGHVHGTLQKRVDAVLNKNLFMEDKAGRRIDAMDDVIASETFRQIITKIIETPAWGISGLEFIPGPELKFEEIPRKHIKPEKKLIGFEQTDNESGIPYQDISNIWVIGQTKDLGYLLKVVPYVIWLNGNMGDWAQYIEIFGQPVRIIYYDAYDTKTKMELRQVLEESGSSLAMMIPKQAQFEMKDGKGTANANGELQEKFNNACKEAISVVIVGNTETTTSSKSSGYAQAKEHGKQQLEVTKSDIAYVQNLLNDAHFLRILKSYALPVPEGARFKFAKEVNLDDLKKRLEIDTEVNKITPIGDDYFYETFSIPKPKDYEKLKAKRAESEAMKQPPLPAPPPVPKAKPPIKKGTKLKSDYWTKLRTALADFFDPAP